MPRCHLDNGGGRPAPQWTPRDDRRWKVSSSIGSLCGGPRTDREIGENRRRVPPNLRGPLSHGSEKLVPSRRLLSIPVRHRGVTLAVVAPHSFGSAPSRYSTTTLPSLETNRINFRILSPDMSGSRLPELVFPHIPPSFRYRWAIRSIDCTQNPPSTFCFRTLTELTSGRVVACQGNRAKSSALESRPRRASVLTRSAETK